MNSGTAVYWMPVTVDTIGKKPSLYASFGETKHRDVDGWFTEAISMFKDIYGTVVDAYYVVDEVRTNRNNSYDFIINIVVTGLFDSEADFHDKIIHDWPADIIEQLKVAKEEQILNSVVGYDYNPIQNNPEWSNYN